MKRIVSYRIWLFLAAALFGVIFTLPSIFDTDIIKRKITLGLDLKGGMNLLLEVRSHEAIRSKLNTLASSINYESDKKNFLIDTIRVRENSITFEVFDEKEMPQIDEMLSRFERLEIQKQGSFYEITFTQEEIIKIQDDAVEQAVGTIRKRLNSFGLDETIVTRQGRQNILVEVPGKSSPAEEERLRNLITKPSHLKFMAVDEDRNTRVNLMTDSEASNHGDVILPLVDNSERDTKILLKRIPILDGSSITSATPTRDQNNQYVVSFTLDSDGARAFGNFTSNNIGKRLAIVLDDKVYSAPVIRARITDSGQISGNFDKHSSSDLAITLKSGALPASLDILEKRSVGPSLGADSIQASLIALVSGFLLVVAFMVIYYRFAGLIAVSALLVNILIIIAVMAIFGATLTLPGMAGLVLTVGMAVDANIIINERIREALREGCGVVKAVELGYSNASRAIFDSNITTLLVAVLLYAYGSGAIQGFAITLSFGILASILTAIVGTHGIYELLMPNLAKAKNLKFWFGVNPTSSLNSQKSAKKGQ